MSHDSKTEIDLQQWADLYDTVQYPPAIYDELVVEKVRNDQRFNVIGAWKTGCISATGQRHAYTDKNGTDHFFTKRWQSHCPVGYRVWNDLARRDPEVVVQVPSRLTLDTPDLVTQLCRRKGFGFIWAVFVLHCVRPKTFPLYDQHVFRSFRWRESDGSECPKKAPDSWAQYRSYAKWFNGIVQESTLPYWIVDRAIWTYGKSVKQLDQKRETTAGSQVSLSFDDINGEWVHETTFGGKKKCFWWMISPEGTVQIQRRFRNSRKPKVKTISPDEMEQLQAYMQDGRWRRLSNNVAKLGDGTEQTGIGRFLVNELGWTVTDAQLAGHLGVILSRASVWGYNGKLRRIEHRRLKAGWREPLADYYLSSVADVTL